jgi:hypothetical protein
VLIHSLICRSTAVVMSAAFKYGRKYSWNFCAVRNLTLSGLNSRLKFEYIDMKPGTLKVLEELMLFAYIRFVWCIYLKSLVVCIMFY